MRMDILIEPADVLEPAKALPVYLEMMREMEAEFSDRAVAVLKGAGFHAWRNPAGHIGIGAS